MDLKNMDTLDLERRFRHAIEQLETRRFIVTSAGWKLMAFELRSAADAAEEIGNRIESGDLE